MYEIRKLPKMKVSLRRKIHIIGLPQGTFLKARWSDDKSATMPCRPFAGQRIGRAGCCVRRHGIQSPYRSLDVMDHNGTAGVQIDKPR